MSTQSQATNYIWDDAEVIWDGYSSVWENSTYSTYVKNTNDTIYTSGEYLVLASAQPYHNVSKFTSIQETLIDTGVGTILKKEFRYSIDNDTFSEFQELTLENIQALGSFCEVWFQFRYILLSGGPVTVQRVCLGYDAKPVDPYYGYIAPAIQDESRVYAFPVIYKSNFLWEPYKMNRAIRLYKDLNLMVNSLFGHDVHYYRVLPQGRSKDVFLMEYSLYEHNDKTCMKVVVPNNEFPDNKLNMGPFGVDFELPFEIQMDKDYFQKIFGEGSGPQKRDVIYFPRTNRIYEVSSSYLFRDFMNEPLYFKATLIKWLPKTNVEPSDSIKALEELTASAEKLFGESIRQEEVQTTNPQQFNVATTYSDPVRYFLDPEQGIKDIKLLNYYTVIAEHFYTMENFVFSNYIKVKIKNSLFTEDYSLTKGTTYFVRFSPSSTQPDVQYYYSMEKMTYMGDDQDGNSVFSFTGGNSQIETSYKASTIFFPGSEFYLYENEYDGTSTVPPVCSCSTDTFASYFKNKIVEYKADAVFPSNEDRAFSSWFRLKENTTSKNRVTSLSFDQYTREITMTLEKSNLDYFYEDEIVLKRIAGTNFMLFGKVVSLNSSNSITIQVDQRMLDFVQTSFPTWYNYTDIEIQRSIPRVFISSLKLGKGIQVELVENRHFRIICNDQDYFFSIPNNLPGLENSKWYSVFVNFSNTFKQLTLNVWSIQWDSTTNLPATTDLKLTYNKTLPIDKLDRSSDTRYYLVPSFMDLTNVRLFNRTAETDKQVLILNQYIVKDAQWALVIDNAMPQSKLPYVGYTR